MLFILIDVTQPFNLTVSLRILSEREDKINEKEKERRKNWSRFVQNASPTTKLYEVYCEKA